MDTSDKEVEKVIKQTLSRVEPSRAVFSEVIKRVTSSPYSRYNKRENQAVLSPYQSSSQFFMKKGLIIGVPVIALALVAVISAKSAIWPAPVSESVAVNDSMESSNIDTGSNNTETVAEANLDTSSAVTNPESQTVSKTNPVASASADKTIDDVFAALMTDVEADTASLASEEDYVATINAELQNYNNVKNANYEDLI